MLCTLYNGCKNRTIITATWCVADCKINFVYDGSELCVHWEKVWWQEAKESQVSCPFIIQFKTSENNGTELAIEYPAKGLTRRKEQDLEKNNNVRKFLFFFYFRDIIVKSFSTAVSNTSTSPLRDDRRRNVDLCGIRIERENLKSSEKGRPNTPVFTTNTTWIALGSNPSWICSSYEEIKNKYKLVAGRYKGEKKNVTISIYNRASTLTW